MEYNTKAEVIFDVGSLYARLQTLRDSRKPKGLRYPLTALLAMMVLAKLCGEDTPSGIADWVKYRSEQMIDWLKLKHRTMPHHSTYRRISEEVVEVDQLERISNELLSEKKYFGSHGWESIARHTG